ncbi:hypothetical protein ACWIGW_44240 [Nocardia brasiliensis]|uniref:hypothetical protein n=1 Tax=Streptomyces sp. NPDC056056 TaxID=3345698 RepID=UPI0035DC5C92
MAQRLPLRIMLGGFLDEVEESSDHLAVLAELLYETLSPQAEPPAKGLWEWVEKRLTRREHAQLVSEYAGRALVAIEDLYRTDFFDLAPDNLQGAFRDLGLTQDLGRAFVSSFVAASVRSDTEHEDLLKRAAALHAWSARLRFTLDSVEEVLSDVRGADLLEARIDASDLDGLRWSTDTIWPPQWREQIARMSVPRGPGEFEIVGGGDHDHEPADGIPSSRS